MYSVSHALSLENRPPDHPFRRGEGSGAQGYPRLVVTESRGLPRPRTQCNLRYFSDRSALEAALANEAARQLELVLRKAAEGCEPVTTIREMSSAYITFARDNRHLYEVMMSLHAPEHDATFRQSLWTFTVEQVQRIAGSDRAAQASVALWAFLHGAVALEAAQVFGESKPASGLEFGLDAWLMAVSTRGEPIEARVKFPQRKPL